MPLLSVQALAQRQQLFEFRIGRGSFATNVANHTSEPCFKCFQLTPHALELFRVCVAACLDRSTLRHTNVRLSQYDTTPLGRFTQLENRFEVQFCIGRMRDVFLLYRGVDVDLLDLFRRHLFLSQGKRDRLLQEQCQFLGAYTRAPLDQRRRMQRQLILHRRESAEVLPIRVFDPTRDDRLVRFVERVFQIVQPNHQPHGLAWRTVVGAIAVSQRRVETLPIDLVGKFDQRMIGVQNLIEMRLKKMKLVATSLRSRLHACLILQGFEGS